MTTIHKEAAGEEQTLMFTKGAPDALLARCSHEVVARDMAVLTETRRAEILKATEDVAGEALRTLALAYRVSPRDGPSLISPASENIEHDLVFAGLIGMIDPPRDEAEEAVARAKRAGIRPIMITGDHPRTAEVITMELGIAGRWRAITGEAIEKLSDQELVQRLEQPLCMHASIPRTSCGS
jgi:Ca2+-transporting ATPase